MKLWGGRFQEETAPEVEAFTASIPLDKKLYREDIAGSIAHAQMLAANGIISEDDAAQIKDGLLKILAAIENGEFTFSIGLEDIHMNIERRRRSAMLANACTPRAAVTIRSRSICICTCGARLWRRVRRCWRS